MKEDFLKISCSAFWIFCTEDIRRREERMMRRQLVSPELWIVAIISNAISPRAAALFLFASFSFSGFDFIPKSLRIFSVLFSLFIWQSGAMGGVKWTMIQISPGSVFHHMHTVHNKSGSARWKGREQCEQVVVGGKMSKNCSKKSSPSPSLPKLCSSLN